MQEKDELLATLRNLSLDRQAVDLMRDDIAQIEEDSKKELPAIQREALEKERLKLQAGLIVTEHHVRRTERLLSLLPQEEQKVLDRMVINPVPEAAFDLAEELHCETSRVYRLRARALRRLLRLRYGAGE